MSDLVGKSASQPEDIPTDSEAILPDVDLVDASTEQGDPVIVRVEKPEDLLDYISAEDVEKLSEIIFTLSGEGVKKIFSGFHWDMALEPLVFCNLPKINKPADPGHYEVRRVNKLLSNHRNEHIDDDEFVETIDKAFSELKYLDHIVFEGDKLCLPYGSYDISGYRPSDGLSPIILSYLVSTNSFNSACKSRIYDNLEKLAAEVSKTRGIGEFIGHDITFEIFKLIPAGGLINHSKKRIGSMIKVLEHIFFRLCLPLLLMDKEVIKGTGCTILDLEVATMGKRKIEALYVMFLSKIELVKKISYFSVFSIQDAQRLIIKNLQQEQGKKGSYLEKISAPVRTEDFYPTHREDDKESIKLTGKVCRAVDLGNLDEVGKMYPNFQCVIDYLKPYVRHSYLKSEPLYFPPLLIAGPPGIGKSSVMAKVFEALGYPVEILQASQLTSGWGLVGLQNGWSSAHQGIVAKTMQSQESYNPMICLDELDKISYDQKHISVESALLRLLEPIEAVNFRDANFDAPHDVSGVNWIFTCNYPKSISGPLISRLKIVYVYPPTKRDHIDSVHINMWKNLVEQHKANDEISLFLSDEILAHLAEEYYDDLNFRRSKITLGSAALYLISKSLPGVKVSLTLHVLLDREKSVSIKPIVLH